MFQYALFDLDGTLTDPKEGICKSVQHALKTMGIEEPDLDKLESFIGPPLTDSFMDFYGFTKEEADRAIVAYRERFSVKGLYENNIFPGIPQMLQHCKEKGMELAVASSKPTVFVEKILKLFEIDSYFSVVVGSNLDGTRAVKEEVVEEALRQLKEKKGDILSKENTAMVGDRKFDIQGARAHGLTGIGVSFGYAKEGELEEEGADFIADSVEKLEQILLMQGREA